VFDIRINRFVTEYQAEIAINEKDGKVTAEFLEGVGKAAQYGKGVKVHSVSKSVEQMIPCERVSEHFGSRMGLPISAGSVCNFKREAYEMLETYEE
jgi:transposase